MELLHKEQYTLGAATLNARKLHFVRLKGLLNYGSTLIIQQASVISHAKLNY